MCKCELLVEARTTKPIEIPEAFHSFSYHGLTERVVLLENIKMSAVVANYAAAHEISGMYGVKKGYMFILGEADDTKL